VKKTRQDKRLERPFRIDRNGGSKALTLWPNAIKQDLKSNFEKPRNMFRGFFDVSGARPHPHHEAVEGELGDLHPRQ
jgi:hypothetical protein